MRYARALLILTCFSSVPVTLGQELTPRAYWPTPEGTKVAVIGYAHSSGDTLFDRSIPLYGVESDLDSTVLAYLQSFSLAGRSANITLELPYSDGETDGFIETIPASGKYSGFSDIGVTLSFNLVGAPSMTPQEFQALRADPHPILGASIKVVAPTGDYNPDRLLNVGANRWAVKPELGYMLPLAPKWLLELEAGVWLFGDDDDFVAGKKEQDPIYAFEAHLVRRFKPGFWASLDANYYTGGRQTIGGDRLRDVQRNGRIGATLVVPFAGRHAIKIGYATGSVTNYGTDFDQFFLSYQVLLN